MTEWRFRFLTPPNIWQKFGNAPQCTRLHHSAPKRADGGPKAGEVEKKTAGLNNAKRHAKYLAKIWQWVSKRADFRGFSHDFGLYRCTPKTPENARLSGVKLVAGPGFEPGTFRL